MLGDSFGADLVADGTKSGGLVELSKEASAGGEGAADDEAGKVLAAPGTNFSVEMPLPRDLFGADLTADGTKVGGCVGFSDLV